MSIRFIRLLACLVICCYLSPTAFAQITPQMAQESTRLWLLDKVQNRNSSIVNKLSKPSPIGNEGLEKGLHPDVNISNSPEPESEVHAAINPLDTNNIIVATMRFAPSALGSELSIPIYYTNDFGESWTLSAFIPTESGIGPLDLVAGGGDPVLAFSEDGTAHFTWLLTTISLATGEFKFVLLHATSVDNGASWQTDESSLDEGTIDLLGGGDSRAVDKEWMSVDDSPTSPYRGNLYATYLELTIENQISHYQVLIKKWDEDNGFAPAVVAVDSLSFFLSQFITPTVSLNGDLHLSWLGVTFEDNFLAIYHTKSSDGGQTFSDPQRISYVNVPCFPPMTSDTPCIPGVDKDRTTSSNYILAGNTEATRDHLYVVWSANGFQEEITPGFDVYFSRSTDNGESWSTPAVLNQDAQQDIHNFMPYPNLSPDGKLSVSWYDQREAVDGSQTDYFGIISTDGGENFSEDFLISCLPSDFTTIGNLNENFGTGEYNSTVSTENYFLPFWSDGRLGDGNLDIFFAKIPFDGSGPTHIRNLDLINGVELGLSPNPARHEARLQIRTEQDLHDVRLSLINLQGQSLASIAETNLLSAGATQFILPTDQLAPGSYLIMLYSKEGQLGERLIVVK